MAVRREIIFQYKTVKGPLHRVPALLKIILLLPLSVFLMPLPPIFLAMGIIAFCICAFICKFTLREQLSDVKPAAFYALLMYGLSVFSKLIDSWRAFSKISFSSVLIPDFNFLRITLRLIIIIQLSSFLFRTTSQGEIREALFFFEKSIRTFFAKIFFAKNETKTKNNFSGYIALFLSFIPEIFETWAAINMAWKARGGGRGFVHMKTLVFVLISLSMEKAAMKAKALEAREK